MHTHTLKSNFNSRSEKYFVLRDLSCIESGNPVLKTQKEIEQMFYCLLSLLIKEEGSHDFLFLVIYFWSQP